jgi:Uma2 family endonuclease
MEFEEERRMSSTLIQPLETEHDGLFRSEMRFEIVDGKEIEVPPMSVYSDEVGIRIFRKLSAFLDQNDIGQPQHEVLFRLPLPEERNRIPDVSFTSYERWPKDRLFPNRGKARDVAPDLAVEVISPGDEVAELMIRLDEFFRAGVRLVWVVHCNLRHVHVWESLTSIRVVTATDELDGGSVLPGFRVPVASLFPPMTPDDQVPSNE